MTDLELAQQHRNVFIANQRFYSAFESLDIREMALVWAQEDWVQCVHPGWPRLTGWRTVRDSWVRIFNNTRSMKFNVTGQRVSVHGPMAWVVCVEQITSLVDDVPQTTRVMATNIFVRRETTAAANGSDGFDAGSWLMAHHHGSPIFQMASDSEDTAEA